MNSEQQAVLEFHKVFGSAISNHPSITDPTDAALRLALIAEEFNELIQAVAVQNPVKVADALGDLLYVIYGAGNTFGIDLEPVFWEIHRSNMTKVPVNGNIQHREDGKIIKPETYTPPDLETVLECQEGLLDGSYVYE